MEKYGIDNVRGGFHVQPDLSEEEKNFIHRSISNLNDSCFKCNKPSHFANKCDNDSKDHFTDGRPVDKRDTNEYYNVVDPVISLMNVIVFMNVMIISNVTNMVNLIILLMSVITITNVTTVVDLVIFLINVDTIDVK